MISVVSMCYTFILNRRLYTSLEEKGYIGENQAGFTKTIPQEIKYLTFMPWVQTCLSKKVQKLHAAFVDIKKGL